MSEDIQELIKKVSKESDKTVEEIQTQMNLRKEKTHGLLSDYGALYAVAKEQGIDLTEGEIKVTSIKDMEISSSVNVVGKVKTVFGVREFSKKDGSKGKFASIVLADVSGEMRVVFWNQNTDVVKNLKIGDVVLVKNGYSKEHQEKIEIHAGNLTNISVNPPNLAIELPEIKEETNQVQDLDKDVSNVNLVCRVSRYFPAKEFDRKDGSKGKRASFIAEDETGQIRVVLWDGAADQKVADGDIIKISQAYTRVGLNDELELQAGSSSKIEKSDKVLNLPELSASTNEMNIADIKPDMKNVGVTARVLRIYPQREYSGGVMSSLIIGDGTSSIRLVLWNDQAAFAKKVLDGDAIKISNGYSRANLSEEPELHAGKYTKLEVDEESTVPIIKKVEDTSSKEKLIDELEDGESFVKITGKITAVEDRPLFFYTCPECSSKVQNLSGSWMCDTCGLVEAQENMMASIIVEDKSSNIRVVSFREIAESAIGLTLDEALNIIGETQDEKTPLEKARELMVGKTVEVVGNTRFNDFNDSLELIAQTIKKI